MKTCIRCKGKLSSAARCAGSRVCTACAVESGELSGTALPVFPINNAEDWNRMLDRFNY